MSTGTREPVGTPGPPGRAGSAGPAGPALPPTTDPPDGPDTGPIPALPGAGPPPVREAPPAAGVSRVTVLAPRTRIDVALPADVPVAELVPVLLDMTGEPPGPGPGWTLALLGDAPADPERSLGGLGVLDGDQLVLLRAADAAPAPLYDDVVDAVAEATPPAFREWGPASARGIGTTALAVSTALAIVSLVEVGRGPGTAGGAVTAAVAAVTAVVALALGAVASRRDRRAVAGVLAVGGVGAAGVAGVAAVPAGAATADTLLASTGPPHLLLGSALVALAAGAALLALGAGATAERRVLASLVALAALGVLGSALGVATVVADALAPVGGGPDPAAVAAGAAALATVALSGLPRAGIALARLPLPPVPGTARELAQDDEPPSHTEVERRTDHAHAALTGLVVAVAATAVASAAVLAALPAPGLRGILGGVLAGLLVLLLALRSRAYANAVHASLLLLGAVAAAVGALLGALRALPPGAPGLAVAGAALVGGAGCLVLGGSSRRRPSPSARRAAGVAEAVAVAAVLPVALGVMDLYTVMRLL